MRDKNPDFKYYDNTFYFSMENRTGNEEVKNDFMVEGDLHLLAAGLAQQLVRHPEIVGFLETALNYYDKLVAEGN